MTRTAARPGPGPSTFSTTTVHEPGRRRRRTVFIAALLIAAVATGAVVRYLLDDSERQYLSTNGWPSIGQGAYQLGTETPRASGNQRPVPIASVAKVMTALVVLEHLPLTGSQAGPSFTVEAADVRDTDERRQRDESVVSVRAGERLTERDALMAVLLPSANNIAVLLARHVSGSVQRFVAEMNRRGRQLGMTQTHYTDPSGYARTTVSTAIDQLLLARVAARQDTLAQIMATRTYRLPVAGVVHNTDTLLGSGGFVGMKTGSDDAAGGCFMFHAYRSVNGFNVEVIGVVLGQHGHRLIAAGLYAARELVDRVAPTPAHP